MNCDRTFIIAHPEHALNATETEQFRSFVARRAAGEPLQYITGRQEFFKLDFQVTRDVLIPRPESEAIVEAALALLPKDRASRIVDVGTGSGCLAISILHELPSASGIAVDVSIAALNVARGNANRHGVVNRLELLESDLFSKIEPDKPFDLIVSNPPYVSDDDMNSLPPEVRCEPRAALAGGPDGLSTIRRLLNEAPQHLHSGGHLVFEFGFGQHERLPTLVDQSIWSWLETRPDLQGIPRTIVLQRK